jgi:hypothetical protein
MKNFCALAACFVIWHHRSILATHNVLFYHRISLNFVLWLLDGRLKWQDVKN